MKNIFSKTTAEKRTQNGVKTDSKRTNYGIRILIFAFLTLGVGQAWGATSTTLYFCPKMIWSTWATSEGIKVQVNRQGDADNWVDYTMSKVTGVTYDGYDIYKATFTDLYDGLGGIQFHNDSWTRKEQPFGEKDWHGQSVYNGKIWDGDSWNSYETDHSIASGATVVWDLAGDTWSNTYMHRGHYVASADHDSYTKLANNQFYKTYASKVNCSMFLFRDRNDGTWSDYKQTTDITGSTCDISSGITLFTYPNTVTGKKLDWQVTTGAKKATSGTKIYFDNTDAGWGEVWFKYGTQWYNRHSGSAATKVTGTANLYVITMPNDAYYEKYYLASDYGWTGYNPIEDTHVAKRIGYVASNLTSDITYVATGSTSGSSPTVYATTNFSGHTRTLTITAPSNGSISVTYTDEGGVERTKTSGSFDVAQTCKVTITATPNDGYALSALTLGGASITSGAEQIIRADGTIAATFVAETTYSITVSHKCGSRTFDTEVLSVGVTTPRNISSQTIDGFSFSSWSDLTNVTNKTGNLTTDPISIVSTAAGSMTCNYTQWPCTLHVNSSAGATGAASQYAMSYDATAKAYYKEFTTTAATQYFRFYINSKKYAPSSDTEVVITGTKVDAATDVTGYASSMPSVYFNDGGIGSQIIVWYDYENGKAWVEEKTYNVTVAADSEGDVSPKGTVAVKQVTGTTLTATPDADHAFSYWAISGGGITPSSSNTNPQTFKASSTGGSITAKFQNRWIMKGSGGVFGNWDTDKELSKAAANTYRTTLSLVAGTAYAFQVVDRHSGTWYGKTSTTITKDLGELTKAIALASSSGSTYNMHFTPVLSGDYTFTYNSSSGTLTIGWPDINKLEIVSGSGITPGYYDFSGPVGTVYSKSFTFNKNQRYSAKIVYHSDFYTFDNTSDMTIDNHTDWRLYNNVSDKICNVYAPVAGTYEYQFNSNNSGNTTLTVVFPTAYTITFGAGDINGSNSTISVTASPTFSSGDYVLASTAVTFNKGTTKDGYEWKGWYSNSDGTGTCHSSTDANWSSAASTRTGNISVYACYNYSTYTVTMTTSDRTGYGSGAPANQTGTYTQAMPTITPPTAANGYCFMGYWDGEEGTGTKYYNANGTSAHVWDKTSGATLYAYFKKAEITGITFSPGNIVAPSATVTVTATIEPIPVGPTTICWRVLYSNDNPLDPQPTFTPVFGGTVSFPAHSASGSYKVEATLRKGAGCGGDEIHTFAAPFQVAGDHTVTVQYKCGDTTIKAPASVTGKPLQWTEITAPEIVGYSFSKWVEGDGITIDGATEGEKASATINFKAIYDGKLTAVYTQKRMIYFYNTLNWENVYVYFYKDGNYWDNSNGTGTDPSYYSGSHNSAHKGQMLPVTEGSKIYYFDAEEASIPAGYTNVAFTEKQQDNCWYFYDNNKVVRRGDYQSTTMPLFVPLSEQPAISKNSGAANYYCEGYWMNYPANSGYTLRIYDTPGANNATGASREFLIPFSEDVKMPLKQEVEVNFSGESWFIIYRNDGTYLEGSHTFKQTDHGDKKITSNDDAGSASKMRLISDGSGIYTFTLSFRGDGGENYDYYLNVDFPAAVGDYRIVYSDNATWSNGAHSAGWYHPSDIIGKNTSETEAKEDTVSFFISHGSSPSMKFQRISAISESAGSYGKITWEDVPSGSITIPTSIEAPGVYNFIVTQPAGGASISLVKAEPYTGNYYIRTDCAGETKWNNFRSPDHLITYSEYSIDHGGYSHYYAHWVQTDDKRNIQFCIANDYSSAISDTLVRENNSDPAWANINNYIDVNGNILRNANVRFMWNQSTNKVSRAYVDGAQGTGSNNFLYMLSEDNKIRKTDESALDDHKVFFSDNENWIYEANIQAQPNAAIKLLSNWGTSNTITQYFKGTSSTTEDLIDGSGENWYNIRLLYDFKTNRLVAAMVPKGNIDDPTPIHADVMFIREHQGDIDQLTFTEDGSITDIETAYAVMRFNKWTLNNKEKTGSHNPLASPASIYERSLYYVSFPFRVKLSEVFGFGTYGQHWIIQRYRGDLRAQQGYWAESAGFWEFIWNRNGEVYLEPNEGYILTLETELLGEESSVWGPDSRSSQIELFFPSYGTMPNITNTSITQTLPAHTCTINRAATEGLPDTSDPSTSYNRTIFDSHWNIMSVPTYLNVNNPSLATTTWLANDSCPKFLYTWNPDDNTLTATSGTGFMYHAMHAYTVQYYGNVTWTTSVSPAAAPQRNTEYRGEYEFCLEVQQDEQMIDRTFVRLSDDENVTTGFEFGEDMTKQFNSRKANIFTIAGNTSLGGNSLPLSTTQTTVVPVGVSIKSAGDYTFAIPEGTEGIGVTLVDNETGVRTSLSALSYTVTLQPGNITDRFVLEISPIAQTPTGVETVTGEGLPVTGVRKVMIDGILYIVKDGKIFDARGARVE